MNNSAPLIEHFQKRVQPWMMACFGAAIAADKVERNHRFFEEATEAVQANGMTRSEAHQLVDYTFDRPVGELHQEIGGVMVTLAALCLASGEDMHAAGETELARIWTKVDQIRAKQAAKPKHSPLPAAATPDLATASETLRDAVLADNVIAVGMVMGLRSLIKQTQVQAATGDAAPAEPKLDKRAQVGNTRFGVGVKWSTVIACAQKHHAYMTTPERESERISKGNEFLAILQTATRNATSDAIPVATRNRAAEWGEYLAKRAELLLDAINDQAAGRLMIEEGPDEDTDLDITEMNARLERATEILGERMQAVRSSVYEFRRRVEQDAKDAASAPKGDGND